nr:MAG TPA: hypothetical protein [Bacteriophage sp.]
MNNSRIAIGFFSKIFKVTICRYYIISPCMSIII